MMLTRARPIQVLYQSSSQANQARSQACLVPRSRYTWRRDTPSSAAAAPTATCPTTLPCAGMPDHLRVTDSTSPHLVRHRKHASVKDHCQPIAHPRTSPSCTGARELPALRAAAAAQGSTHDRGAQPVWHTRCAAAPTRTFRPLGALLGERTTPELTYPQARFAGLASYGISASLLAEVLPLGRQHPTVIRSPAVAQRRHCVLPSWRSCVGDPLSGLGVGALYPPVGWGGFGREEVVEVLVGPQPELPAGKGISAMQRPVENGTRTATRRELTAA